MSSHLSPRSVFFLFYEATRISLSPSPSKICSYVHAYTERALNEEIHSAVRKLNLYLRHFFQWMCVLGLPLLSAEKSSQLKCRITRKGRKFNDNMRRGRRGKKWALVFFFHFLGPCNFSFFFLLPGSRFTFCREKCPEAPHREGRLGVEHSPRRPGVSPSLVSL